MQSRKNAQSTDADMDQMMGLPDDMDDMDMMYLVYPDGRTKTVSTQQSQSKD